MINFAERCSSCRPPECDTSLMISMGNIAGITSDLIEKLESGMITREEALTRNEEKVDQEEQRFVEERLERDCSFSSVRIVMKLRYARAQDTPQDK